MQAVRAALDQLRLDGGGPLLAAVVGTSGPGLGTVLVLIPVVVIALWRRGCDALGLRMTSGHDTRGDR